MKIIVPLEQTSLSRIGGRDNTEHIEFDASSGDGFARRAAEFINKVGRYCAGGASRTIGIIDASDDVEREIKLHIDGDGADFLRDVKLNGTEVQPEP